MRQRLVTMMMRMPRSGCSWRIVRVLMMRVMLVMMFMLKRYMLMRMLVILRQVQPHTRRHERAGDQ